MPDSGPEFINSKIGIVLPILRRCIAIGSICSLRLSVVTLTSKSSSGERVPVTSVTFIVLLPFMTMNCMSTFVLLSDSAKANNTPGPGVALTGTSRIKLTLPPESVPFANTTSVSSPESSMPSISIAAST